MISMVNNFKLARMSVVIAKHVSCHHNMKDENITVSGVRV